jgi:hypothetical protein
MHIIQNKKLKSFGYWNSICLCLLYLLLYLLLSVHTLSAQKRVAQEYQVKAAFLFNFTRFIDWPETAFDSPDAPFLIGILGANPFGNFLEQIVENEKVNNHRIKVVYCKTVKEAAQCHLLYVNVPDNDKLKSIIKETAGKPVLTVSDMAHFLRWGGHIRFFKELDKIRLQINVNESRSAKLTISSKLLDVAQIY